MGECSRRGFLKGATGFGGAALAGGWPTLQTAFAADAGGAEMQFGLVTYQWGRDWDVPSLIKNLTSSGVFGVELRTTHAHKVEPTLSDEQRREVRKQFADSPVKLVSIGSAEEYHNPDPARLARSIEATKAFVKLSHDVGSSGVKVRPNDLPKGVDPARTIEQIGKALNVVGAFAADYGQQIRLEVHGGCARLPIIRQIMDVAMHPHVAVCWNSNNSDQEPPGLEHNFNLVKDRLGYTTHVRELDTPGYAWQDLITLLVKARYKGWCLLEAGSKLPEDRVAAIKRQRELFERMVKRATA